MSNLPHNTNKCNCFEQQKKHHRFFIVKGPLANAVYTSQLYCYLLPSWPHLTHSVRRDCSAMLLVGSAHLEPLTTPFPHSVHHLLCALGPCICDLWLYLFSTSVSSPNLFCHTRLARVSVTLTPMLLLFKIFRVEMKVCLYFVTINYFPKDADRQSTSSCAALSEHYCNVIL